MTPRLWIPLTLAAAIVAAALLFGLAPSLDLDTARLFYGGGNHFVADTPLGNAVRKVFYWLPTVVLFILLGLWAARRLGRWHGWAPTGRGALFLLLTITVGPGLLANTLLKEHSHRPRPYQTTDFGGDEPFQPFNSFSGACQRNCSFVSGEGATSAWTLGPALLVPAPWQGGAVAASLVFALCSGTLRLAFGGHYLSDAVFAVLLSWTVLWLGWVGLRPRE